MKPVSVFLIAMAVLGLSACNTIQGMGKDIQAGGQAIERKAEENRK